MRWGEAQWVMDLIRPRDASREVSWMAYQESRVHGPERETRENTLSIDRTLTSYSVILLLVQRALVCSMGRTPDLLLVTRKVIHNRDVSFNNVVTSPPEGVARYCFHPYVCVSVCPANILVFYFSAIRRDIDLKFIQDTYRVVLNSLKKHWLSYVNGQGHMDGTLLFEGTVMILYSMKQ